jgi:sec-independent protein translocase protein TatA
MFGLGFWELLLIAVLILVFFGSSRLPEIGRGLGAMVGKLKSAARDREGEPKPAPPPEDKPSAG